MKPLCIYHGNCADGFGAAWVVRKYFGEENIDFFPGVYQQEPPDVTDRDVIMVDFSYKREIILKMAQQASAILILDHHKSAEANLVDLPVHVEAHFDMDHSGAMMAWMHFFPNMEPPQLLKHIQDRDLWRFRLEGTRQIQANVFSYPYDFDVWDGLMTANVSDLQKDGEAIERKHFKDINEFIESSKHSMTIDGIRVPALNAPYFWSSDAGHIMAQEEPFAACYWRVEDGWVFSLRSTDTGVDVSEVATKYGGGGHRNAAGFKIKNLEELYLGQ